MNETQLKIMSKKGELETLYVQYIDKDQPETDRQREKNMPNCMNIMQEM